MSPSDPGPVAPQPAGVSRRTVVKGAAWTVPAVAVASAVPAQAASPTGNNLAVAATDCSLVTIRVGSENPGFRYTVTEGTIPAGTQIEITTGGTVSVGLDNFTFDGLELSAVSLGGNGATFTTLRDLAVGESIDIGLDGLTVDAVGTYTTTIISPDDVQTDDIAIMNTGGVGLGSLGVFVCYDLSDGGDAVPDVAADVVVDFGWCEPLGLVTNPDPSFVISAEGGSIPAGTEFLLYSQSTLDAAIMGGWTFEGDTPLSIGLVGTSSNIASFTTPREITPTTPLEISYSAVVSADLNSTFYLAYLGNDTDPTDNAKGMTLTGVQLATVNVASCQQHNA